MWSWGANFCVGKNNEFLGIFEKVLAGTLFFFFFFFLKFKDCVWWSEQCVTVVCHSDPGEASLAEIFFRFEGD